MTAIAGSFSSGLIVPAVLLALLGWAVPRFLAIGLPEGVPWLLLNGFLSTFIMGALGAGYFALLYVWQGVPFDVLFENGTAGAVFHFLRLSVISVLLWGPVLLLSLSRLPRKWVKEVW